VSAAGGGGERERREKVGGEGWVERHGGPDAACSQKLSGTNLMKPRGLKASNQSSVVDMVWWVVRAVEA
jgi:hypothetical protein